MDSRKDPHILASFVISLLFGLVCLGIWLFTRNSANTYLPAGAAFFGLLVMGVGIVPTISKNWTALKVATAAWREYLYFRYWKSASSNGRFSRTGAEELIRSGQLKFCGFQLRNDRYHLVLSGHS